MITRTDIASRLEMGIRTGFLTSAKQYTPLSLPFVRETTSDGAFETYSDLGSHPWPRKNGGQPGYQGTNARSGAVVRGGLHEGGPTMIFGTKDRSLEVWNDDWDVEIGILHTAIDDDRVGDLLDWASGAGRRFREHRDWLCFNALTQGGSATSDYGLCYDKQPLFSASHTAPAGSEYTAAQSNQFNLALTPDNLETVDVSMGLLLDDHGQPVNHTFTTLVVPQNYKRIAYQLATNPDMYNTGNRETNPWYNTQVIVAPGGWLDSTSWYRVASNSTAKPIILQNRADLQLQWWDSYEQGHGVRFFK